MPPPMSKIGEEVSMAALMLGSLLKVAVREPRNPRDGVAAHTMSHGKRPRTIKTANNMPQNKNHFRALRLIPPNTSALIIALSTLEMTSKSARPMTMKIIENIAKQ
jgi:hypothetical protein